MPTEHEFNVFGIVMTTVCVPFFFLIGSLNTTQGMRFWRSKYHQFLAWCFNKKEEKDEKDEDREILKADDSDSDSESTKQEPGMWILVTLYCQLNANLSKSNTYIVPIKRHKRTLSTSMAMQKRQNQINPVEKPPLRPPISTAKASAFESAHTSLTLHSRSNSEFVVSIEDSSEAPKERSRSRSTQPAEIKPVVVEILPPKKEEVDYGNRRIEGAERRVINVGLGIRDGQSSNQGRVISQERSDAVRIDVKQEKETMWWGRMTGKRKEEKKKTKMEV